MVIRDTGYVTTPANFVLMSAQGQVAMSWSSSPLVSSYQVWRSANNVSFTQIGTTTNIFYNDTSGTVDTIYYYYIIASNGTNTSLPTPTLSGQSLTPGQTTVGNLRLECRQRTDRVNSDNITTQEWNSMISQSYKELWDILAQKFGDDYFVATPYTYTTGQNVQFYPLPVDFKALLGVEIALNGNDPNSWITIKQFEFIQRNLWNSPNIYTLYNTTNIRYRLNGSNLMIVPNPQANQTLRIWYVPRPNQLINDTDIIDGVAGWEEYIVTDVCIKALAKTEEDIQVFMAQKQMLLKRIEEAAENRNIAEAQTVSDVRRVNFSWSDGGMSGFGGGDW